MSAATRDGSSSARSRAAAAPGRPQGVPTQSFVKLVERTRDAFAGTDETNVEEVQRILVQVRQQYDTVHHEAEQKEVRRERLRDAIRAADDLHERKNREADSQDELLLDRERQLSETRRQIAETQMSRKVYEHMLARIQKEQAILKQKMLRMEGHLGRKRHEAQRGGAECERLRTERAQNVRSLDALMEDAEAEREATRGAREAMEGELDRRRSANKRRGVFESWRHEVALKAANEAFNASAGHLRKLYAIEKLAGNCLQKLTFEQVEKSQNTEDGFQKIREVTGLTDVMDIVHKFLNREVETEQLKGSVKEAEARLESLRSAFDTFKRDTEGITFDKSQSSTSRSIYKEIEQSERGLNDAMEEHEACRARLQKITLQTEHMKRWALRVGQTLSSFEEPVKVEGPQDLAAFFRKLEVAVERFVAVVAQQISDGKITRRELLKVMKKEYDEQERTLLSKDFLQTNCRVPAAADAPGRAASRQGTAEDDPANAFAEDRERCKKDSAERSRQAQVEQQKKRPKGQ
uniref:ODAD1 central coiled coil region domain-containing protein n=1 Tax=Pyrodinium bahamense TaxID=73915 RepID=A0A7S0A419_9DINO|mmetsp:Transcript_2161/g.6059  ORF Transcript_2161/g.6059 Transcript_2161/m.6059 type:complete len:522 (+) Transcript_2161:112-1677(+)